MPATDIFRRKSQNLSTAIESIYGLRTDDQADKALAFATMSFSELAGFTLSEILAMQANKYVEALLTQNLTLSYMDQLVKFLLETAEIYESLQKNAESNNLTEKALYLLRYISHTDKTYSPEREEFMAALEIKIQKQ